MGCSIKNDNLAEVSPRRKSGKTTAAKSGSLTKTNPRSRVVNRSSRAAEFAAFADDLHSDLNPRGPLERVMADHVVQSAWRLKGSLERQSVREFGPKSDPDQGDSKGHVRPSVTDRAAKAVRDAVESLDSIQRRRERILPIRPFEAVSPIVDDIEFEPNEWPVVPSEAFDDFPAEPEVVEEDDVIHWRDRLVFDFDVSDISPVVKGTWITVSHVVTQIVDGATWADILRSHPELTEDDIRTCIAYAMDEENSAS